MKNISKLISLFEAHQDERKAAWHYAYLRCQFPFLGIQKPFRKRLQAPFVKEFLSSHRKGAPIIQTLWDLPAREYKYVAMDTLSSPQEEDFPLLEYCIQTKSWWDTVDILASNHIGKLCKKYPSLIPKVDSWINHSHLWLRRSALLYQLRYKEKTDEDKLFTFCKKLSHEKEFFIQRAIAWALREYAKTSPQSVKALFKKTTFSTLVKRECGISRNDTKSC